MALTLPIQMCQSNEEISNHQIIINLKQENPPIHITFSDLPIRERRDAEILNTYIPAHSQKSEIISLFSMLLAPAGLLFDAHSVEQRQ